MKDSDCVLFLQWCLPKLRLRWPGFRKVRRQVCRRIDRRIAALGLRDLPAYRAYLEGHPAEWRVLDALCRISISRFYRDKGVFQCLERDVLPDLARAVALRGEADVRCWSAGCAAGEEPYTLAVLWRLRLAHQFPALGLKILATDADPHAIERAVEGCFPAGNLKELPEELLAAALVPAAHGFRVREAFRAPVTFLEQDLRVAAPDERFHLVLCRNLAFTYFDDALQRETLRRIEERLSLEGALVIGRRERLPEGASGFELWGRAAEIYRRVSGP
ncbi:MAG TPA: CheR family methyltransferase [Candidatus Sulfotelmatobacter sp.]|nr:CheR family methyltransferase [Candidatus Sulfotelmatobacter sp.]